MSHPTRSCLAGLSLLALGCGDPSGGGPMAEGPPPDRCRPPATLPAGRLFTDVTAEIGLAGVTGIRATAADLDGDGWPDLIVHGAGNARDKPPVYLRRVLMNRAGKFVDATAESGMLDSRDGPMTGRLSHLSVFGDVDNDGDLDAFAGTYAGATDMPPASTDRSEILLNDGKGHFAFADASAPSDRRLPTSGAAFVDYDRDGLLDLFVGTWYAGNEGAGNYLYKGAGDGTFSDVSRESGVLRTPAAGNLEKLLAGQYRRAAYGVTACDVDNDGDPDLMTSAYGRSWNELWRNDGAGKFTEIGQGTPFAADDLIDYAKDNQFYHCYCAANAGKCPPETPKPVIDCRSYAWNPGFDDQPARQGGNYFSTACADVDNDGDLDVMHAAIRHWHIGPSSDPSQLVRNDLVPSGKLGFTRVANDESGLFRPMEIPDWNEGDITVAVFDFDNDGRKDIYLASSDYPETYGTLFRQTEKGTFTDISARAGVRHYHAVGLAVLDYDRDGDLDLVVASSTARCSGDPKCPRTQEVRVYRNDAGAARNYLQVRLRGAAGEDPAGGANRAGIGARVSVKAGGVTQVQEVSGGYGHFGMQHDTLLTFGLGDACQVDEVEVRWPGAAPASPASIERFTGIVPNYAVELRQGDAGGPGGSKITYLNR